MRRHFPTSLLISVVILSVCFCVRAQADAGGPYSQEQILKSWGWLAAQQQNLAGVDLRPAELGIFLEGFSAGLQHQPSPCASPSALPEVEKLAKNRREKIVRALVETNEARAKSFFSKLATNADIIPLPDGVRCKILKAGDQVFPQPQQTVTVHYTGRLLDGTKFAEMGPLEMVLVTNRSLCRGWVPALQRLGKGGTLELFVPPPLTESDADKWGVPPGSTLIFDIQLLDVKTTSSADLENALLPPAPEPPEPPASGCSESELIKTWGWTVARALRLEKFGLTDAELAGFTNGLAMGIAGGRAPVDPAKILPFVQKSAADHREKIRDAFRQKQASESQALFTKLKQDPNVVELADGLRYEILQPGNGPYPKPGQIVLVDYTARLLNGTIFDQTYNEPLHIQVGAVIPGWNEGIQKINRGGKIRLYIPPKLGYGSENHSGVVAPIPPDSTLIYEITLLDLQDVTPDDAGRH